MTTCPSLEQYSQALQHPNLALTDASLKRGRVTTTGQGLPLALCGGFALTYTIEVDGRRLAVRCFHKRSEALERRYAAISRRLRSLSSPYFVEFEFQPTGIRIAGASYPIVKMAWAPGVTLGEFLESHHTSKVDVQELRASMRRLSTDLAKLGIAHGDIQTGNVMVSDRGRCLQLVDYDGMYVEELESLGSAEIGHRNFQHPKRSKASWGPNLDRFSFITLDLALRVLEADPKFWESTSSDGDAVVLRATDYADPVNSATFQRLTQLVPFGTGIRDLAQICAARFEDIPSLDDFISRRNIPAVAITISADSLVKRASYVSNFNVLDASDYEACLRGVGDRVELVGLIEEVKLGISKRRTPYVFLNFGHWLGDAVKVSIWSDGLDVLGRRPSQSWAGRWVSVVGLMEPPYRSKRFNYSHLSITITQADQFHFITSEEASFRLGRKTASQTSSRSQSWNTRILGEMKSTPRLPTAVDRPAPTAAAQRTTSTPGAGISSRRGSGFWDGFGCCLIWIVLFLIILIASLVRR